MKMVQWARDLVWSQAEGEGMGHGLGVLGKSGDFIQVCGEVTGVCYRSVVIPFP